MKAARLFFLFLASAISVFGGSFDKSQLLPLLRFPLEDFEVGFSFTESGISLGTDFGATPDLREQIARAELHRALHPDDPQHYLDLAFLHKFGGKPELAAPMFSQAEALYKKLLADRNASDVIIKGYAQLLQATGKRPEAEAFLRRQLDAVPQQAAIWSALAINHALAAYEILTGESQFSFKPQEAHQKVMESEYSAEQLAGVEKHFREALSCFDRALQLQSSDPDLYRERMIFHFHVGIARELARNPETKDAYRLATHNFCKVTLDDFRKIAALNPDDPEAVAVRTFAQMITGSLDTLANEEEPENLSETVSEETKASLRGGIAELKKLSKRGDTDRRRTALIALGFFQSVIGETRAGEKNLRKAIALDPTDPLAWETLAGVYTMNEPRWRELLAVCRQRARDDDSARNRFIAAKAAEELKQPAEAMKELQRALKLDPKHTKSKLALGVLYLREGSSESIQEAHKIIGELIDRKDLEHDEWRDLMVLGGTCYALADQSDDARRWFDQLLQHQPDDERAKKALAAWKE